MAATRLSLPVVGRGVPPSRPPSRGRGGAVSPVQEAMEAAGVTDKDNMRVFSSVMMGRDTMRCLEEIHRFASERRQGEMANVRNLAAMLVQRLKAVEPPACDRWFGRNKLRPSRGGARRPAEPPA